MSDAPVRIWASPANGRPSGSWNNAPFDREIEAEYVRADLHAARIEALEAELFALQETQAGFLYLAAENETALAAEREKVARLVDAGDWLSVCAQTTGGTAGRDDGLVEAIERWSAALAADGTTLTGEKP